MDNVIKKYFDKFRGSKKGPPAASAGATPVPSPAYGGATGQAPPKRSGGFSAAREAGLPPELVKKVEGKLLPDLELMNKWRDRRIAQLACIVPGTRI